MCINKKTLLNLTKISFCKGFKKPEITDSIKIESYHFPIYRYQAVVLGTGAAGLRAAIELKRKGIDVVLITKGLYQGTSACSGSDKQTLYTLSSTNKGDNFIKMSHSLSQGGGMDQDIAYVEAVGSIHTQSALQFLGLPLPEDKFGSVLRYQTDHDEVGRGTSCGPKTSRLMVKVLLDEVLLLQIPILDNSVGISLLQSKNDRGERFCNGLVICNDNHSENNPYAISVFLSPNVIIATGGPGELYRDSVYPRGCYGSLGLALEADIPLNNIIESQFGIGTPRSSIPWNLSGTYMQAIPYIYSVDQEGNEYNFLENYYRSTKEIASNIFRKGYQWPFHSSRLLEYGSSLIDIAIAQEYQKNRIVYMDFTRNPQPILNDKPFNINDLDSDVSDYLKNNQALLSTPIERLEKMNPLSIELYLMHGHDLRKQPLMFTLNNQHMNGGIEVNIWGETEINGCYAIGEVAGTHGVTRPGGAALNAGQVFAIRVSQHIKNTVRTDKLVNLDTHQIKQLSGLIEFIDKSLTNQSTFNIKKIKTTIQNRMSDYAGFKCNAIDVNKQTDEANKLNKQIHEVGIKIEKHSEIAELFLWKQMALTSAAILNMLNDYIKTGGGSRGARIILDENGSDIPKGNNILLTEWRFKPERVEDRNKKYLIRWQNNTFISWQRNIKKLPNIDLIFFEKDWVNYLNKNIFNKNFTYS